MKRGIVKRKRGRPPKVQEIRVEIRGNLILCECVAKEVASLIYQLWKEKRKQ